MKPGSARIARIREALREAKLDALVCTLPANVLMLSGYWPVVGSTVAVAAADGRIAVLTPEDERDVAIGGWADEVRTYQPGSLSKISSPVDAVREPLADLLRGLGVERGSIGYETGDAYEPASYVAMYLFGHATASLLGTAALEATLSSADVPLANLRAWMTEEEVGRVRLACRIAAEAFKEGARRLRPGLREAGVAAAFRAPLSIGGLEHDGVERADGFVYCMSGPNAATAGAAYAQTRDRALQAGDLVLVHCNSYVDGYWTDITRTYCLGAPDQGQRAMYEAVFAARTAALSAIHPGVQAREVDHAARAIVSERGFGEQFTHGLGHNVGFSAISMEFAPRIHPASDDLLEIGMTFNIEPAIYIKGYGGVRHCDVVTIGEGGAEVLTPFQTSPSELFVT
jgi:Xaa-Pro aminopeptidase